MGSAVAEPIAGPLSQLGIGAIVVVAAYYLVKYFMSKLDEKDARIKQVTDEYIAAMKAVVDKGVEQTKMVTQAIADNTAAMSGNTTAMNELKDAVRSLASPVVGPRASDMIASRRHP